MIFGGTPIADATIGVGITDQPEGLAAICRPGCAAAIWEREAQPAFQNWINDLPTDQLPKTRMILRALQCPRYLPQSCRRLTFGCAWM